MYQFSCSAHYVSNEGERSEVIITIKSGDLQIVSKNGNEQMVYLPSNSMDTILCFAREIDEIQQISTLDFHNPESQINVSFLLNLKDIEQLKLLMRGRQVFLDTTNYIVLGKLASGIQLVQTQNKISVEKKATLIMEDSDSNSRLGLLRQEAKMLRLLKDYRQKNIILLEEIIYDLLTKMLQKESHLRPSANECLSHPYFKSQIQADIIKERIQIKRKFKKQKREALKRGRN